MPGRMCCDGSPPCVCRCACSCVPGRAVAVSGLIMYSQLLHSCPKKADYFINARMSGERAWPPTDMLLARRQQVTPGLRSPTSRPPNPPRFGSSRSITSYHQSQQSTQASLTECLSHTPTPTTTPCGDGTGRARMPPRVATAIRPAISATNAIAARRNRT